LTEAIAKLEVLQTSADPEVRHRALNFLADAYAATGRNWDSEAMLRRSIELCGERNEGLGPQLAVLAPLVRRRGRIEEAEEIYARALDIVRDEELEIRVMTLRNCLSVLDNRSD
jgi:tetratricopeptide (TPR) repeat protein